MSVTAALDFSASLALVGRQSAPEVIQVLIVDDHPVHQTFARCAFEALGCRVSVAEDGVDAISQASARRFDLILMDRNMPRCGGDEAVSMIRRQGGLSSEAVIIAHSTTPPSGAAAGAYDGVVSKPIRVSEIVKLKLLQGGAGGDGVRGHV